MSVSVVLGFAPCSRALPCLRLSGPGCKPQLRHGNARYRHPRRCFVAGAHFLHRLFLIRLRIDRGMRATAT
ncbi:MAG: hypothetical protein C0524_13640 [Rhodobacter sp.]|nr:hypothetical protein [Rhodobacter sp.]